MTDRQNIGKKTVIVVDDEPIIRMDLGQMLEELNYEVIAVLMRWNSAGRKIRT